VVSNVRPRSSIPWKPHAHKSLIGIRSTRIEEMPPNVADLIYEPVPGDPLDPSSNLVRRR
jgi:hypothetical protein